MTTALVPQVLRAALPTTKFLRNTEAFPDASVETFFHEETNRICRWRVKELATFSCPIAALPESTASDRARWRFAFRTSTHCLRFVAEFIMATADGDGGEVLPDTTNASGRATFATGGTHYCIAHYGVWPDGEPAVDVPSNFRAITATLVGDPDDVELADANPNTDYTCTIYDIGYARTLACTVYEVSYEPTVFTAVADVVSNQCYLPSGVSTGGDIENREPMIKMLRNAWQQNGAQLWNWASNTDADAPTRASATAANWIDQTITTASAESPGVILDLRYRGRANDPTNVYCTWKIYASCSSGTGRLQIYDSSNVSWFDATFTTLGWYTFSVSLPAVRDKFELKIVGSGAGTTTVYASSLYQLDDPLVP